MNEFERQLYVERQARDGNTQQVQEAEEAVQQAEARAAAAEQRTTETEAAATEMEAAATAAHQQRCICYSLCWGTMKYPVRSSMSDVDCGAV